MSYYGEATDSIYHFDLHSTLLIYMSSSANLHDIWTVDADATTTTKRGCMSCSCCLLVSNQVSYYIQAYIVVVW